VDMVDTVGRVEAEGQEGLLGDLIEFNGRSWHGVF
jgi:hypothetical protein